MRFKAKMSSKSPFVNVLKVVLVGSLLLNIVTGTALTLTLNTLRSVRQELSDLTHYNKTLQYQFDVSTATSNWQKRQIRWLECQGEFNEQPEAPTLVR